MCSHDNENIIFEIWEASPTSESVLKTKDFLEWSFPGTTISLPIATFYDEAFLAELSKFLGQADHENVKAYGAKAFKAGISISESRDTAQPHLISRLLTTILGTFGTIVNSKFLIKHIRDDVNWDNGAENPWRRSPIWMSLRVAIQRRLYASAGDQEGRLRYKIVICVALTQFLDDAMLILPLESTYELKAKICYRMAKLEADFCEVSQAIKETLQILFSSVSSLVLRVVKKADGYINSRSQTWKQQQQQHSSLPKYPPRGSLYLALRNSKPYFDQVLNDCMPIGMDRGDKQTMHRKLLSKIAIKFGTFARACYDKAEKNAIFLETDFKELANMPKKKCTKIAKTIMDHLDTFPVVFEENAIESSLLVLTVMEAWVEMDRVATSTYPLLLQYHTGFFPSIFECLQLQKKIDMDRLHKVEFYLEDRNPGHQNYSLFIRPSPAAFAYRFVNESGQAQDIVDLQSCVETETKEAKIKKGEELKKLTKKYETLTSQHTNSSCTKEAYDTDIDHSIRDCLKCKTAKQLAECKIGRLEIPLPEDPVQATIVCFELRCPKQFQLYRDATWKILNWLQPASTRRETNEIARVTLADSSATKRYLTSISCVTLASSKKSFLRTHYAKLPLPVEIADVIVPSGLKYEYYDPITKRWPGRMKVDALWEIIPPYQRSDESPLNGIIQNAFAEARKGTLSSNYILSTEPLCPREVQPTESLAVQSLISRVSPRCLWLQILIELGRSTINFSSEATSSMLIAVAHISGRRAKDSFRSAHGQLASESFSDALLVRIKERLDIIANSIGESNQINMIIDLLSRVLAMTSSNKVKDKAIKRILEIRIICYNWITADTHTLQACWDPSVRQRYSRRILLVALLSRKTFWVNKECLGGDALSVQQFVQASIAMQRSLDGDVELLTERLQHALRLDLKMMHLAAASILNLILLSPTAVVEGLNAIYTNMFASCYCSKIDMIDDKWISGILSTSERQVILHFHPIEGHVLINGRPEGRLPAEFLSHPLVLDLFENHVPSAWYDPSTLHWKLGAKYLEQDIYIGKHEDGSLFIRAYGPKGNFELVPRYIFEEKSSLHHDLPGHLIDNHFHWLDLHTRKLHIRRSARRWETLQSSWILDTTTCQATRRAFQLIDPSSAMYVQIWRILSKLEHKHYIVAYKGLGGRIWVELPRLELRFKVNNSGHFESSELQAEIDPDQDAGTFYGLESKLVIRDLKNIHQRSLIVPFGSIKKYRSGDFVRTSIEFDNTSFARFEIDDIMGRLSCAPEPRLLYFKALLHAVTTNVMPDPLTGRTGADEAVYWLSSGTAMPWQPLSTLSKAILTQIAVLAPCLDYHPPQLRRLKKSTWSDSIPAIMQDPRYRPLVKRLFERSETLLAFQSTKESLLDKDEMEYLGHIDDDHLVKRLSMRCRLYKSQNAVSQTLRQSSSATKYKSRDRLPSDDSSCKNVARVIENIKAWPQKMTTTKNLPELIELLSKLTPFMTGYDQNFDNILLSDLVDGYSWIKGLGPLLQHCRGSNSHDKFQLAFLLGSLAFNKTIKVEILIVALAFALWDDLKSIQPPPYVCYDSFKILHHPGVEIFCDIINPFCIEFGHREEHNIEFLHIKQRLKIQRAQREHKREAEMQCQTMALLLLDQWPTVNLSTDALLNSSFSLINVSEAITAIHSAWKTMISHYELTQHLNAIQAVLSAYDNPLSNGLRCSVFDLQIEESYYQQRSRKALLSLPTLFQRSCPIFWQPIVSIILPRCSRETANISIEPKKERNIKELESIIVGLESESSRICTNYASTLTRSLCALKARDLNWQAVPEHQVPDNLDNLIVQFAERTLSHIKSLEQHLQHADSSWQWLQLGSLSLMSSRTGILQTLRSTGVRTTEFGVNTRAAVIHLAVLFMILQRLYRIRDAMLRGDDKRVQDELRHLNAMHFDVEANTDWLLFELDSNITLRPAQVRIARATISPDSRMNSLHQMMMGDGKTSCVLPISVLALADGKNLVRIVVPRALIHQTAQLLQGRIGTLSGRIVLHIPFSRKSITNPDHIRLFHSLHRDIMLNGGVIVTTPEHILSFMLSGIQKTIDRRLEDALQLIETQKWLQSVSRNILDESDLLLDCKTQLIYPSGTLSALEGHPHRWQTIQRLLKLLPLYARIVQKRYPAGIYVCDETGGYPSVYLLRKEAEDALVQKLSEQICFGSTDVLGVNSFSKDQQRTIHLFMTSAEVNTETRDVIDSIFADNSTSRQILYLLRGLFVHRLLVHALKKRWNVQYGIAVDRDPIAVPFVAKGVPSENAEFGHPDVSIILTVLAFYYGGISRKQLQECLEVVLGLDDPNYEYGKFCADCMTIPDTIRDLHSINVKDESHVQELHDHLRRSTTVCDFFLNHKVFPKHARHFDTDITASSWDLTAARLMMNSQDGQRGITTGFSGTIDNAGLLPLTIAQEDLADFSHTNAEVLTFLLEARNSEYVLASEKGRRYTEQQLLVNLRGRAIKCLIDSGAYILELSNVDVAKLWLEIDTEAPAAIYFGLDNRPMVRYRAGATIPLAVSPFAQDTGRALVYFSNANCRGSDLRLPVYTVASLTLGMSQTKDSLVQSAMRLRMLSTTQSVIFYSPPEVHQSILDRLNKSEHDYIMSKDVIAWTLRETCQCIEDLQPLFYSQGMDHMLRTQAMLQAPNFLTDGNERNAALKVLSKKHNSSLEHLYGLRTRPKLFHKKFLASAPQLDAMMGKLRCRAEQFEDHGSAVQATVLREVEQEREFEYDVSQQQQVQKPINFSPHVFDGVHTDVYRFIEKGTISHTSNAIEHYCDFMARRTAIGKKYDIHSYSQLQSRLYLTMPFATTVQIPKAQMNDSFVRPVRWILWCIKNEIAICITTEEAELILPIIQRIEPPMVHLLVYSPPTTKRTMCFNDFSYYAVPTLPLDFKAPIWLKVELGIFAGKTFFGFDEYEMVRYFLGLEVVVPSQQRQSMLMCRKPLSFLREWLTIRLKGREYLDSPLGQVIQGHELTSDELCFHQESINSTILHNYGEQAEITGPVIYDEEDNFFEDPEHIMAENYEDDNTDGEASYEDFSLAI